MGTYREGRTARVEKLRGYSAANAAKSEAAHAGVQQIADMIPFGQPIIVGHYSEKGHRRDIAKMQSGMTKSVATADRAAEQAARADEIERQAARAIYDDDPDAIERLTVKLTSLEAARESMKLANANYRKEHKAELKEMTAYMRDCAVPFKSYQITNLGGTIGTTRKRLERLQRQAVTGPVDRLIAARFASKCADCDAQIEKGQLIRYNRQQGARCQTCEG
jgi:hypothetical protein